MVNTPSKEKSPADMVAAARKLLRNRGVSVQVLDVKQLEAQRLGGVLGVGQGSEQTPRFLKMTYAPSGARGKALALVGKGVVFDSGGLSLKTGRRHGDDEDRHVGRRGRHRGDVDARGPRREDAGRPAYVPLVENMPSGTAIRPGDVLTIRNGKTVEVLNTDAEGRLILADALSLASEDKPDAVIDLATLTGACMVALGDKIAGLMGNDDAWVEQVQGAADRAGEPVWHAAAAARVPQAARVRGRRHEEHRRQLRRRAHRGAVPPGVRRRRALGAPRHRRARPRQRRRRLPHQGRHRIRGADAGGAGARLRATRGLGQRHGEGDERPTAPMTGVRRGRLAVGGLALLLVTAATIAAGPTASARVAAVQDVVTVHIRDNTFAPANLNVPEGTTVRWVNDGRNTHNVTPSTGSARCGSGNLKPGKSYVRTFEDAGTFAYYCTLHGTPTSGQHAELGIGDAAAATPLAPVGGGAHEPPTFEPSGRTIRVPADAKTIQAGVDRAKEGDLVLVSPGVYRESVEIATDGIVLRGLDRNRTILDGEFRRANGVFVAAPTASRSRTSPPATTPRTGSSGAASSGTGARTSPRTATATTASTRTTRSTGSSTTRTRRAAPTPASTSASATRVTR